MTLRTALNGQELELMGLLVTIPAITLVASSSPFY